MINKKQTLNEEFRELVNSEYNDDPVHYCKRCLSLNIRVDEDGEEFCDECTSTNILKTNIFKWEKLYAERYGRDFLNN